MENKESFAASVATMKGKKGGKGTLIGMIIFMLISVGLGVWVTILLINNNNGQKNSATNTGDSSEVAEAEKTEPAADCPSGEAVADKTKKEDQTNTTSFDYDAYKIDYAGAEALVAKIGTLRPIKIDHTKDGKYTYIITEVIENGAGGYTAVFYRENKKGATWAELQSGHNFADCSYHTDAQKKFMSDYKYIDDDLDSKYIGCYENSKSEKVFPE